MVKTITPMTKLPPMTKPPKACDDVAGGGGAFVAVAQDEPRRGEVERQAHHRGRCSSTVGKDGEFERPLDEQRHHQDEHGSGDRERQADIEQPGRHRQDEHDQDRDDAERQRDLAAPQRRAERREARQGGLGGLGDGGVGHGRLKVV